MSKYLFFLLFPISLFSQTKPLSFELDAITHADSTASERIYTLEYHITNKSDKAVSFVLDAEKLIPINGGSQSHKMYFKIFENEKEVDMDHIFDNKFKREMIFSKRYEDKTQEEIEKISHEESMEYFRKQISESIMSSIIRLKPNEIKKFKAKLYWNRERYRKQGDIEYYINETGPYFIELSFNLMTDEFENKLSPEEFQTIRSDQSFIKGWYTSNKMEINFKE